MTNKEYTGLEQGQDDSEALEELNYSIDHVTGEITMELDDEQVVLKPSLGACMGISKMDDSPLATGSKIMSLNFETICQVVALGLGVPLRQPLREKVYKTGLFEIRAPLMNFIHIVNNGGKPPPNIEVDDVDDDLGNVVAPTS